LNQYNIVAIVFLLVIISGCTTVKEVPVHKSKVLRQRDKKGQIRYQRFEQIVEDKERRYLITVGQKFDSLGRLIEEHGFYHHRLGGQYRFEITYAPQIRVINSYSWAQQDQSVASNSLSAFKEQKIFIDTATYLKTVIIEKIKLDDKWFTGRYTESYPRAMDRYANDGPGILSFLFKMPVVDFSFDSSNRIILKNRIVIDQE
jgi:hypothetical protein